jgi:general secretion pathway protein M
MTTAQPVDRTVARHPVSAVASYVAVVASLLLLTWASLAGLAERRRAVDAAADMLARLEGRAPVRPADRSSPTGPVPVGSPFLEGATITVAGADLLQRVSSAVKRAGGNVLSSQVELQGPRAKEGYLGLIASCDIDHAALQRLLYDLEAGMPFLFVDQLVVQAPLNASDGGRARVQIAISGLWARAN